MLYTFTFDTWIKDSTETVMPIVVTTTKKTNTSVMIPFEPKHKDQGFSVLTGLSETYLNQSFI